jgi:hypothetical protein
MTDADSEPRIDRQCYEVAAVTDRQFDATGRVLYLVTWAGSLPVPSRAHQPRIALDLSFIKLAVMSPTLHPTSPPGSRSSTLPIFILQSACWPDTEPTRRSWRDSITPALAAKTRRSSRRSCRRRRRRPTRSAAASSSRIKSRCASACPNGVVSWRARQRQTWPRLYRRIKNFVQVIASRQSHTC